MCSWPFTRVESGNYELMILSMGERERHAISVTNRPLKMPPPSMPLFVICLFQQWPYNVRRRIYSVVQKKCARGWSRVDCSLKGAGITSHTVCLDSRVTLCTRLNDCLKPNWKFHHFESDHDVKCVSKVLGQMWALLALRECLRTFETHFSNRPIQKVLATSHSQ